VSKATHTHTTRGQCSRGRRLLHGAAATAACAALGGALFLVSVADAEEPKPPPSDLTQTLQALHELYTLMETQLDVMADQQRQYAQIQLQLLRMTSACGRKPAAPPIFVEPER
jgi:hypothetical protein